MDYTIYEDFIKQFVRPELLVLIPVLYFIAVGMKKSRCVSDNMIPALIGAIGILLSILWIMADVHIEGYRDVLASIFAAITQGILCAGGSVYLNQLIVKQPGKKQ